MEQDETSDLLRGTVKIINDEALHNYISYQNNNNK